MVINHVELLDGRAAVVAIEGPLDSRSGPEFEEYIRRLLDRSVIFIIFNAGKMEYVSSEGIGLLLYLQSRISEDNGFFVLFGLSPEIETLFSLLGFDRVFRIVRDRAEAVEIMDRQMEMRERGETEDAAAAGHEGAEFPEADEPVVVPVMQEESPAAGGVVPPVEPPPSKPMEPVVETTPHPAAGAGPRMVKCEACGAELRTHGPGDYLCPHCDASFNVPGSPAPEPLAVSSAGFGPLIVECASCKSLVRVKKSGAYKCPECGKGFTVGDDQTVAF